MDRSEKKFHLKTFPWLAEIITIIGAIVFAAQTWTYIHTQVSILDEGNYLVKGLLFVRGDYQIYQDYGPWSNHMPLSFYIPGIVQYLFGPGIRAGRYLAFTLGLLLLLGVWLVARRWGGRWWAAVAVWVMALNPAVLKMYSVMSSQVLVASMLTWVLVFTLAEKRSRWQLMLGSALAGVALLTRLNLAPLLPLLLLYIFWQHGKRAGIWSTISMGLVVLIGHAVFWPGILRMWATWIPAGIAPFLDPFQAPEGVRYWSPNVDLGTRLIALLMVFQYHFVPMVSVLATLILWPKKSAWKSPHHFRASVFLVLLFGALFLAHLWVTIGQGISTNVAYSASYCVFCLPVYVAFFSVLGIFLLIISMPSWRREVSRWRCFLIVLVILSIPMGIGLVLRSHVNSELVTYRTIRTIMAWQVPRLENMRIQPGTIDLWGLIANRTGKDIQEVHLLIRRILIVLIAVITGLAAGIAVLVGTWFGKLVLKRTRTNEIRSWCSLALLVFMGVGFLISPFWFLGGGYHDYDCDADILAAYDEVGSYLAEQIPPGSSVYWLGGLSPAALLYLDDISLYPPLLNGAYTLSDEGSDDDLLRYGFWSGELAHQWSHEASYILIEGQRFDGWVGEYASAGEFRELPPTPLVQPCNPGSEIRIFQRISGE